MVSGYSTMYSTSTHRHTDHGRLYISPIYISPYTTEYTQQLSKLIGLFYNSHNT